MKTFCLTLPEQPERTTKALDHFAKVGLDDVETFHGIHGEVAGLRTVHTYELDNPGYIMGPKPIAIWLSHYMLWSHIAHLPHCDDRHVMIVEIDAKFPGDWKEKLAESIAAIPPDFDFLFPGNCCLAATDMSDMGANVFKTGKVQCSHCYIVRVGTLPIILYKLRKVWAPIDIQLMLEILSLDWLKSYAIIPRLVDQFDTELPP
jgi:hypothetical protein